MASSGGNSRGLARGQTINVTVDHSTSNLIAVNYCHEGQLFRGVILAENERTGVNGTLPSSTGTWPPFPLEATNPFSLKNLSCCGERFTYQADGQVSCFSILKSSSKRSSRGCFRLLPARALCQSCRRPLQLFSSSKISSDSSPPDGSTVTINSTKTARQADGQYQVDSVNKKMTSGSSKKRHLEDGEKINQCKPRKHKCVEADISLKKPGYKPSESVSAPRPSVKKTRESWEKNSTKPREPVEQKAEECSEANPSAKSSNKYKRTRDKERSKSTRSAKELKTLGVAKKAAFESDPLVSVASDDSGKPPPIPTLKIKILSRNPGDKDASISNDQTSSKYKVEMMTVIPASTATVAVVAPSASPESVSSRRKYSATGLSSSPLSSESPSPSTAPLASAMAQDRISVSACRLSPNEVLRLGDVVWCKLRGWPWWPARICNLLSPTGSSTSDGFLPSATSCSAQVVWFGTGEFSEFPTHRLLPFLPNFKAKLDSAQVKKKHKYKRAIEEALAEARERESAEVNKPEEREKQHNGLPMQLLSDESGSEFGGPLTIDQGSTTSSSSVVVGEAGSNGGFLPQSCSIRQ